MHYKNFLFWGNNKNMTYFLPDEAMNDHPVSDKVVITQLEVDNKSVEIGQKGERSGHSGERYSLYQ